VRKSEDSHRLGPSKPSTIYYTERLTFFVKTFEYENISLAVIESMACGTPAVAPNATTFPEIRCNKTTLYEHENTLNLANKLLMLLTDYNLYGTVKDCQLERVRKSYTGRLSLRFVASIKTSGKIIAIEPNPEAIRLLLLNLRLNNAAR
jgi:glycosyltransferase involved in cell wall biosynthesis